uniref:replication helicase subunit n=1 Tax=Erythrolobus coxiae TaxID=362235 RepID=UPI001FCCE6A6|nr:replication helicase subunit [Erythrolobus coxiae]UNJ17624.1 replication helicase subunit [Erythrolobus coxiae]
MKNMPHNLLVERIIIGAIVLSPRSMPIIFSKVKKEFFYLESHQYIFQALSKLYDQKQSMTMLNINKTLERFTLDHVIDFENIKELASQTFLISYIDDYILLLVDKYMRRSLIDLGSFLIENAKDENLDLRTTLDDAYQQILILNSSQITNQVSSIVDIYYDILRDVQIVQSDNLLIGFASGFDQLDLLTQGFQKSDLIIVAGRPSMGKTAFCLNVASYIAKNYKEKVVIFSLEMSKTQLFYRLVSLGTQIQSNRLKTNRLHETEINYIRDEIKLLANIHVDDSSNISCDDIIVLIKNVFTEKVGIIIIDYLQLMTLNNSNNNQTRAQELAEITRSLKKIARELNIPIILISQVSRSVESRINKRPLLSDLRESGCVGFRTVISCFNPLKNIKVIQLISNQDYSIVSYSIYKQAMLTADNYVCKITGHKPVYHCNIFGNHHIDLTAEHKTLNNLYWSQLNNLQERDHSNLTLCSGDLMSLYYYIFSRPSFYAFIQFQTIMSVYDLEIVTTHNFCSNRVVLHNSIEQDADLVLMLYRDSYYHTEFIDNNDKVTEIIITKHRNGPLGTVMLHFDDMYMKFFNI